MRVKKFNEQDEVDSTALDVLLEIRNDWGVSKISAIFQTASQRGTILESSPGGVYSAKKTPAQNLSVAERLLASQKFTPHPKSEEGRCLLKSFVSANEEENVQFGGKNLLHLLLQLLPALVWWNWRQTERRSKLRKRLLKHNPLVAVPLLASRPTLPFRWVRRSREGNE